MMSSREAEIAQIVKQIDDRLEELRAIEKALLDLHSQQWLNGASEPVEDGDR